MNITATNLAKEFNRRVILKDVSFSLDIGDSLAITGRNGAGKSTLVKMIAGLLSPSKGEITFSVQGKSVPADELKDQIGMVSPYLMLYDEFTAQENLKILSRIRSKTVDAIGRGDELLRQFGLWEKRGELVKTYSSGMKQRLKFAFALLHSPLLLLVDEPTANLDNEGILVIKGLLEQRKETGILILATNAPEEARWCERHIHLGD